MILKEKTKSKGVLILRRGEAVNIKKDSWEFNAVNQESVNNTICYNGWQFVNSQGWNNVGAVIALGNGTSPVPNSADTKLDSELINSRFTCPDTKSRVDGNIITLSALWARGQGYTGNVTEWGIFVNLRGQNLNTTNTGYLVSRVAYSFTRGSTEDVEINWVITIN